MSVLFYNASGFFISSYKSCGWQYSYCGFHVRAVSVFGKKIRCGLWFFGVFLCGFAVSRPPLRLTLLHTEKWKISFRLKKVQGLMRKPSSGCKRDRAFNGKLQTNSNTQNEKKVLNIIFTRDKMTEILSVQPSVIRLPYKTCKDPYKTCKDSLMYSIPRSMSSGSWSSVFNFTTFLVCSDKLVTTAYVWGNR